MANLLILSPARIASVTVNRGTGGGNLLTPDPREVWADSATGNGTIGIDLGAPRAIDTVFLGHILPPAAGAVWAITGGIGSYYETLMAAERPLRVPDVAGRFPALSHAFWHGPSVTVRYLRISIEQPAGALPLTIGVVQAGRAFSPEWNHEWGSGRRPIDTGSATALPNGGFSVIEGVRKSAWHWTLGDLSDAERDTLYELALDRGETKPLLVVEDPASTAGLRRRLHYGKFMQLRQFERLGKNRTRWELQIEEWGADESAPL